MGSLEGRGLTGSQGLDGLLAEVVAVGVGDRDAGDRQVAVVLDVDVVLDGLTELVGDTVRRVAHGGLPDRDVTVLGVGLVLGLARRDGRVAAVGIAGGGGVVGDLADEDVGLGHGVDVLDRLGLAGSKRANLSALALGQGRALELVLNHDVVRGQVAVIGHLDVVGDLLAQGIGAAVLGRAGRGLRNCEVGVGLLDVNLVGVRVVLVLARELDRDGVHEGAGQDVGLGDGVGRGSAHRGAGLDVLELALAQRDAGELLERHRLGLVVDVRGLDGKGHGLAKGVGASLVRLGDDLAVIGRRRHDERAEGRRDGVVALLRSGLGALPIDGVAVLALAHVGLGAGGLELRRLAVHEASDGSGSLQRRAVIGLRRIGSGDLELSLVNGELLGLSGVVGVVAVLGTKLNGLGLTDVLRRYSRGNLRPVLAIGGVLDLERLVVLVNSRGNAGTIGLAVVGLHHVIRRPHDLVLANASRFDCELTLILHNVIVRSLEGIARGVGDGVRNGLANHGDRANGLNVRHFIGHKAGVTILLPTGDDRAGQFGAVIRLLSALGLKRHVALVDGEAHARGRRVDDELHVGEVLVRAHEVVGGELILVRDNSAIGADQHVGAGDSGVMALGEGDVVLAEVAIAARDGNRVATDRVLVAVIGDCVAVALDGHDDFAIVGGDGKGAVLRRDYVIASLGVALELIGELVVHASRIGDSAGDVIRSAFVAHKAFALGVVTLGSGHAVASKSGAVVDLRLRAGSQGHRTRLHRDGLGAQCVLVLGVVAGPGTEVDRDGAGMRERNVSRALRPVLLVDAVLYLEVIVVGALGAGRISDKRGTVVELLGVLLVPRCAVDVDAVRRDLELAIHDDELDVREVAADVPEVVGHEVHVVLTDKGSLGNLVAGIAHEGEAAIGVEAVAGLVGVALNALLVAVVGLGVTVLGDGDGHLVRDRVDLEGAVLGRDGVVLGIGVGVQLVALEHVRTAAGVGLAARNNVAGDALAIYEALAGLLVVLAGRGGGVRKRRAVIGLLIAHSGERHGALIDLELACDRGHGKEAGDVIAVSVLDLHGRNLIGHAAGVGKRRIAGHGLDRVLHVVEGVLGLSNARDAVLGAVIGVLSGVAGNSDGELRIRLGDGEGTLDLLDDVVAVLALGRAAGQRIAEGVRAPTDEQLAAGDAVVRALVPDEAVAGDGHGTVRKRRTVIGLRVVRRRQRDFALGDGKLAVSNDELNVGEVIALVLELAVLEAHRVRAGVGLLHLGGAGVGEVALLIESVVDGDRVARGGLLGAVVLGAGLVARDGHGHLAGHRGDIQVASLGGDGVVDVVALVVLLCTVAGELVGELVVHAADVGDGAGSGGREAVALGEGTVGDGHVLISKSRAVVDLLTASRRQLDSALVDGQSAIDDHELDVGEVLADVLEVARLELHLIGASIGSTHGGGTAEGEVARGVQLVVARDVVARDGVLVAVIGQRVAVLGDGHGDLVGHGVNRQVALDLGDVVVAGLGVRAIKDDV